MPDEIKSVFRSLGRIEQKLDTALANQEEINKEIDDNGSRINDLESSRNYLRGALAMISAVIVWLATQVHIPLPFGQ